MKLSVRHIIIRSVLWHRGATITLLLVTALIAAVITASLLAGYSVRQTLAASTTARLNGGAVMISAGLRYSDRQLATHLSEKTGVTVAPLLELNGSVSSFGGGTQVNGARIWGVDSSFFLIGGAPAGEAPGRGEVILNSRLAQTLKVAEGGSVILRFAAPSDLPRNTPFAPAKEESEGSLFLTVKKIVTSENWGLFNPSISQVVPYNAFISADELNQFLEGRKKANRFLFRQADGLTPQAAGEALAAVSLPGKHSLRIRTVPATGETEIVSDRIFIDTEIVDNLTAALPGARPVITYLANAITSAYGSTPYSFVAALTGITDTLLENPYDIAVNEWLADDIKCAAGDSITLTYYLSGADNRLTEATARFRVAAVVPLKGVWRDSLLMPAFPGITGSRSCTDWDAGIPLDMKRIRDKDEEYWFNHEGTPKAFIRYETGAALWGNQFGPATSIRIAQGSELRRSEAESRAEGREGMHSEAVSRAEGREGSGLSAQGIAAGTFGFTVNDLLSDGLRAASSGVDFSTLFLALSFFIIGAAMVLLIMIVDNHLRSREGEMAAYSALGFTTGRIRNIFLGEALIPLTAGAITGTAAGILFNTLIISALNSVWIDAVQTDTLMPFTGPMPLVTGAVATLLVALAAVIIRVRFFLRQLNLSVRMRSVPDGRLAGILLWPAATIMAAILLMILFSGADKIMLHFAGGLLLFTMLILLFRRILTPNRRAGDGKPGTSGRFLSLRYYAFYPSRALTPLIFIAAGLFIVIATGSNRQDFGRDALKRTSGTGGFTHWIESPIPVDDDFEFEGAAAVMRCLKVDGDDASCLNLNHITSPHLLGVDAPLLAERKSFSLASSLKGVGGVRDDDFWKVLSQPAGDDAIYGFLDQTVMQWGMMLKAGDTVTVRSESGRPLHVIIAGGLKTSVFQGHLLIDKSHFTRWFPSVSGSSIILIETPNTEYRTPNTSVIEPTPSRLESFYRVTNTYLSVFVVMGGIGMVLGVMGMGLNLVRNIRSRRREFALLSASGFTSADIRRMVLGENLAILLAGIITGTLPAIFATWPSLATGTGTPWLTATLLAGLMGVTGASAAMIAVMRTFRKEMNIRYLIADI